MPVTLADVKALFNPNNPYWDIAVQYLIDSGLYSGALISGAADGDTPSTSGGIRIYNNGTLGGTTKPGVALDVIVASLTSAMGGTLDKLSVSGSMPDGATQIGFYDSTAYSWLNSGSVHTAIVDLANKINAIVITSGGGGSGTVTSVDMTVPDIMSVTGNPITEAGTLAVTLDNQSPNLILAGPSTGGAATPTFRSLVDADIPTGISAAKIGNGTISDTEFEYLNSTSANIQTQFNTLTDNLSTSSSNLQNQITNTSNNLSAYLPISGGTLTGDLVGTTISATTLSATNFYIPAKPVGTVYSGPISGSDAIPTFRLLSASDIPSGLDATKISTGTISNTEFDYLNGTSATIQTQFNTLSDNLSTSSSNLQNQITNTSNGLSAYLPLSGGTLTGQITGPNLSSTNISATTLTLPAQVSGSFFAGPISGTNDVPGFRVLSSSDIPSGIDASKISTGSISNTEFDYLNTTSANIQTQFNTLTTNLSTSSSNLQSQITTVSGNLQTSSTVLQNYVNNIYSLFPNYLPLSGGTLTGQLTGPSISAVTISGTSGFYDSIDYRPLEVAPEYKEGRIFYDDANKTFTMFNDVSGSSLQLGRENWVRIRNKSGTTILDSEVVYISSAVGQTPTISRAKADLESTSMTLGLASAHILDNEFGEVVTFGLSNNLDTSMFNDGDKLWLSPTSAGALTNVRPTAPYYAVNIGVVVYTHNTQGKILVHPDTNTHLGFGSGNQLLGMNSTGVSAQYKSVSGISGMISVEHSDNNILLGVEYSSATKEPTGFVNRTDSSISFTSATRTFTISGTFDVYLAGRKYTKTTESIQITSAAGNHFLFYNTSNILVDSLSPWSIITDIPIALVYWTSAGNLILAEERHGCQMDSATHYYLHHTFGTRYVSGFTASYTLANDSSVGFGLTNGTIADEDITIGITDGAVNGSFRQPISSAGSFPVFYRTGVDGVNGGWRKDAATTLPYKNNGGTTLANYNQLSGGSWVQTASTNNTFIAYYIYATDDVNEPVISVQGQRVDTSLSDAQNNNTVSSLVTGDFPFQEAKLLYRLILRASSAYTGNSFRVRIEDIFDYRNSLTSIQATAGGTGTVTSVAFTGPTVMGVSGSPIINAGTINLEFNSQTSGTFLSGPISGTSAIPTFRTISASDIPSGIDSVKIGSGLISNTEFDYLNGTSATIQTQLNTLTTNLSTSSSNLQTQLGNYLPLSGGTLTGTLNTLTISATSITATGLTLPVQTSGYVYAGPISGANAVPGFRLLSASDIPSGIDALKIGSGSVSNTEFGYLDGTSAAIQTQLNTLTTNLSTSSSNLQTQLGNYLPLSGGTLSGQVTGPSLSSTNISATNLILSVQSSGSFFAGPISGANAVPGFRLISASDIPSGIDALKIGTGSVSNTEFGYLDGVTSSIQTQFGTINSNFSNFLPLSGGTLTGTLNTLAVSSTNISASSLRLANTTDGQVLYATTNNVTSSSPKLTYAGGNQLTIGDATSAAQVFLVVNGVAGSNHGLYIQNSGANRWVLRAGGTAEAGADAGTPFELAAYTDGGVFIDYPISILRVAGGAISVTRPISSTSTAAFTSITASGLTSGRIPVISTSGLITDSAGLTYATNQLTVGQSSESAASWMFITAANGANKDIYLGTSGSIRWIIRSDNTSESGANAGSDFQLIARSDAGALLDVPIYINRVAGGNIQFVRPLYSTSTARFTSITASGLTSGQIPTIGTSGLIQSDAGLTYVRSGSIVVTMILGDGLAASNAALAVRAPAARRRIIGLQTSATDRWTIEAEATAESGSNAGSNLSIIAYNDAGVAIDTPISIVRAAAGLVTIGGTRSINLNGGNLAFGGVTRITSAGAATFSALTISGATSGTIPYIIAGGAVSVNPLFGFDGTTFSVNGPQKWKAVARTTSATTAATDFCVVFTGSVAVTETLPAATGSFRVLSFVNAGTANWTLDGNASDSIDAALTYVLTSAATSASKIMIMDVLTGVWRSI